MARIYIFDLEADGLLDEVTKIHCLSYTKPGSDEVRTLTSYEEIVQWVKEADTLIAHNGMLYDLPTLEKILGVRFKGKFIDTLALSWYLRPNRVRHGLEGYGEDYGVPKPEVVDWKNLSLEEYCHRCEEDVKINQRLWVDLRKELLELYEGDKKEANRFLSYLMFKMECASLQQKSQWKLDVERARKQVEELTQLEQEKIEELKQHMPSVKQYAVRTRPAKPFKKDGTLSVTGVRWFALLKEEGLPKDFEGEIKVEVAAKEPNPGSSAQVKDWLFSLGWEPQNFDYKKNEDGSDRMIPQVRVDGGEGKELCPSVKELIPNNPAVGVLDGLTIIQHRLSIFKGFLENGVNGFLTAEIGGLTNTLRFKHRVLVNLPGVNKPYGEDIRGSLIAREGYELCGSDVSSLEDNTKRHYMWDYDPEYVTEMSRPGFDPHLDLAKFAGAVTQKEIDDYVGKVEGSKNLKPLRDNFKVVNYSATYGVGAAKLSRSAKLPRREAEKLLEAYWQRNWSIKKFSEDQRVKHALGGMWVYNPVSKFWYSLRNEKDIFSTVNQSTGVYVFDSWMKNVLKKRKQLTAQFHDECVLEIKQGNRDRCETLLREAMEEVNHQLKLNVTIGIDVQFGQNYSQIH